MRRYLANAWVMRAFTAGAALLLVVGVVSYVQSRPDPSPATNTTSYGRDYELPVTTTAYTAADLPKDVRRVAGEFILAAAGREDLEKAWKLTHPELRAQCACTYKHWLTGDIPVQYYPTANLDGATFGVDESTARRVVLEVLLTPKEGQEVDPQAFFIGLKAVGKGAKLKWLVDYWAPIVGLPVPQTPGG